MDARQAIQVDGPSLECHDEGVTMTETEQVEYWKQRLIDELETSMAFHQRQAEIFEFAGKCFGMVAMMLPVLALIYLEYFMITRGYS
jgi:hypothetical protein